ncbi:MAG: hypothetical protein M3Q32_00765, partial [Pseudomonadota bacterium]|nr:hypothetical protein [Pseudomonadota bacterium]
IMSQRSATPWAQPDCKLMPQLLPMAGCIVSISKATNGEAKTVGIASMTTAYPLALSVAGKLANLILGAPSLSEP